MVKPSDSNLKSKLSLRIFRFLDSLEDGVVSHPSVNLSRKVVKFRISFWYRPLCLASQIVF